MCQRILQVGTVGAVGRGLLNFPQGSYPASGDLKPCVPVKVFLSRGHGDVDGLLEWQFSRASGSVIYCGLLPLVVVGPSKHALLPPTSPESLSGRHLGAPSVWSRASSWFPQCIGLAKAAGDPVHDLGLLLRWQVVLHLGPH